MNNQPRIYTNDHELRWFHGITADRTVLMITHGLYGLERFDRILLPESGRIVEQASHADLVAAGGGYARLQEMLMV